MIVQFEDCSYQIMLCCCLSDLLLMSVKYFPPLGILSLFHLYLNSYIPFYNLELSIHRMNKKYMN
jgi:hypothetical protein